MEHATKCTSCGAVLTAEEIKVDFPCPACGEIQIGRCQRCKKLSRQYECSKCGFVGP